MSKQRHEESVPNSNADAGTLEHRGGEETRVKSKLRNSSRARHLALVVGTCYVQAMARLLRVQFEDVLISARAVMRVRLSLRDQRDCDDRMKAQSAQRFL